LTHASTRLFKFRALRVVDAAVCKELPNARADVYVFTGQFAYGTRADCGREAISRGARVERDITRRTTFLVIGTFGSRDWAQTSFGRKIKRAVELRDSGFALRIVGEDHWATAL